MSYIINNTSPFVSVKLTEKGRERLAQGALDFASWAIGDSEINYDREDIYDNNLTDVTLSAITKVMTPADRQPNLKSFITKSDGIPLQTLTPADIKTVKAIVNNEADERGFFSGSTGSYTTLTGSSYTLGSGTIDATVLSGGTSLDLGGASVSEGDYILLKISNDTLGSVALNTNSEPIPHLWYKVQSFSSPLATVDRDLPNLNSVGGTDIQYIIYPSGEVHDTIGSACTTSYWDSGTLQFDTSCNITCSDVPVWNMNNVWCEDPAGITGTTYEGHEYFGSYPYLGSKFPYFEYSCAEPSNGSSQICDGVSNVHEKRKAISIIHYTNNSISNLYGEYFFIDAANNKELRIEFPDLMYHRRDFTTGSGTTMGMAFVASGATQLISGTDIEYIDLIEDSALISSADTAQVVGKVFPQYKMIVIDDEEIVAATSYKSNRNWTLPELTTNLVAPSGGTSTGLVAQNETIFVTYTLENATGTGLTSTFPCQKYTKLTNNTSAAKDIEFRLIETDLLPYMRKTEAGGYDGRGFHANNIKVLYQVVADSSTSPDPTAWKVYDYTNTTLTSGAGETIDPVALENQNPVVNGFNINKVVDSASTTYDLTQVLSMAPVASPDNLQFGDERFFYGNISTYIGATIFKTIFDIRINSGLFTKTTNNTRSTDPSTNPPDIRVSEVGIYDSANNLVCIGKLSKPVNLLAGSTIMLELSMDF
jgi:hypothetical protein